jgi:hypothetical protein
MEKEQKNHAKVPKVKGIGLRIGLGESWMTTECQYKTLKI